MELKWPLRIKEVEGSRKLSILTNAADREHIVFVSPDARVFLASPQRMGLEFARAWLAENIDPAFSSIALAASLNFVPHLMGVLYHIHECATRWFAEEIWEQIDPLEHKMALREQCFSVGRSYPESLWDEIFEGLLDALAHRFLGTELPFFSLGRIYVEQDPSKPSKEALETLINNLLRTQEPGLKVKIGSRYGIPLLEPVDEQE